MPNWITNILEFNENENIEPFKRFCIGSEEQGVLDFEKFIPSPKHIDFTEWILKGDYRYDLRLFSIISYISKSMMDKKIFNIDQFLNHNKSVNLKVSLSREELSNAFKQFIAKNADKLGINKAIDLDNGVNITSEMINILDKTIDLCVESYKNLANKYDVHEMFFAGIVTKYVLENYKSFYTDSMTQVLLNSKKPICKQALLEQGKFYFDLLYRYGVDDWYNWKITYWGTKWNAYDPVWCNNHTLGFNTAWSSPTPIICKIKELFPDLQITYYWVDEGWPSEPHMYYTDRFNKTFIENVIEGDEDARMEITNHIYNTYDSGLAIITKDGDNR